MAIVEYDYFHYIGPGMWGARDLSDTIGSSDSLTTLNNLTSMIFNLPKSGVINTLGFYIFGKQTGTVSYEIALKTLSTAGVPTTTNYGSSSGTVWTTDDFIVGWNWIDLSQAATGTVGDPLSAILKRISPTGGAGTINVPVEFVGLGAFPRGYMVVSSTYTDGQPLIAVRYTDDFAYGLPVNSFFTYSGDLNDTPDEFGALFSVPVKTHCVGMKASDNISLGGNSPFNILLYDNSDILLTSVLIADEDYVWNGLAMPQNEAYIRFAPVWLEANQPYRLTVRSNNATQPAIIGGLTFVTGTYAYCIPEGSRWKATYRTDAGAWTNVDGQVPYMAIIADKISVDDGAGSTGTSVVSSVGTNVYGWVS